MAIKITRTIKIVIIRTIIIAIVIKITRTIKIVIVIVMVRAIIIKIVIKIIIAIIRTIAKRKKKRGALKKNSYQSKKGIEFNIKNKS